MRELHTDPYGELEFVVGNEDDFICLDYDYDRETHRLRLHAVVNSETGAFIQNFSNPEEIDLSEVPEAIRPAVAARHAAEMVGEAISWCFDNGITHDVEGWNQDPLYFSRAVFARVKGEGLLVSRIEEV